MRTGGWILLAGMAWAMADSRIADSQVPPLPKVAAPPAARVYYFAATAYDTNCLESEFSNELVFSNTTRAAAVTLAWDASSGLNVAGYYVYQGGASGKYTNMIDAGPATTQVVTLAVVKTNRLVTIRGQWATNVAGPWQAVTNWPVMQLTNPAGARWYRVGVTETNF